MRRLNKEDIQRSLYFQGPIADFEECKQNVNNIFSFNKLKIVVITWNMCNSEKCLLSRNLQHLLFPSSILQVQDIYIIGTQETICSKHEWNIALQQNLGPFFFLLSSKKFFDLNLSIFLRRELLFYVSNIKSDALIFGWTAFLRTKGSIAISFTLFETTFLFVNSHFIAHEKNAAKRIHNYSNTIRQLNMSKPTIKFSKLLFDKQEKDITDSFDHIFWFGDFNFRLEDETRVTVRNKIAERRKINKESFASVLILDQLKQTMNQGKLFKGFQEDRIRFPPSYKYDVGTDTYDTSHKNRVPSYTDRVLYKTNFTTQLHNSLGTMDQRGAITCLKYDHVSAITCSDHKPVYALFETVLRPGIQNGCHRAWDYLSRDLVANKILGSVYRRGMEKRYPGTSPSQISENDLVPYRSTAISGGCFKRFYRKILPI